MARGLWLFRRILSEYLGVEPERAFRTLVELPQFVTDLVQYGKLNTAPGFKLSPVGLRPLLRDRAAEAGSLGQYFFQDLWAARKIVERRPSEHCDIGSRIDGFIAHLLCFMPVKVFDIRPLPQNVRGLSFIQQDATSLSDIRDRSIESISSLHALEHFGLGRYGDPVDPQAPFKAMRSIARVVREGGFAYISVPIGRERVEFNAQRVFHPETIVEAMRPLELASFSAIIGESDFVEDVDPVSLGRRRGCGLFEFTRRG